MLDKTKKVELDGKQFILHPLPIMKALKLDKKVLTLLLPILGTVDFQNMDADIDLGKALSLLGDGLSSMNDTEFENFVLDMVSTVQVIESGKPAQEMGEMGSGAMEVFRDNLFSIYKLLFEIMKYNKFSPFVAVAGGLGMVKTFISKGQKHKEENTLL